MQGMGNPSTKLPSHVKREVAYSQHLLCFIDDELYMMWYKDNDFDPE